MDRNFEQLCLSANGKKVFYDGVNSHTATHFEDKPELRTLVVEALSKMDLIGQVVGLDIDMGRVVGASDVVEVDSSDDIVYAMRVQREDQGHVPFTKSREVKPSSLISVYLVEIDEESYELSSAWIGEFDSPNFPQMEDAPPESIEYWSKHAFVWGSQKIIPGTELSECPW